ncbi:hypothetical protein ACVXZ4_09975 [Lacisediminihabitans sp. FW035]
MYLAISSILDQKTELNPGRINLELRFSGTDILTVGVEAKFDHELTRAQVHGQLTVVDQLVILLTSGDSAPQWLNGLANVSVITWTEALRCFSDPRLTEEDIASMPVQKSTVEARLRSQNLDPLRSNGWEVDVRRGGGGMPSIVVESPLLGNGRRLCGQIQVSGRSMPKAGEPVRLEYSIGVSVELTADDFPDPLAPHAEPGWIEPLRVLYQTVLNGDEKRLRVNTGRPGHSRSQLGKRKVPLAEEYFPGTTWLAKGYVDWALGIKSTEVALDKLEELTSTAVEIFEQWYDVELARTAILT